MDDRALSTAQRCKRLGRLWLHGLFTRRSPDFKHGLLAYNLLALGPLVARMCRRGARLIAVRDMGRSPKKNRSGRAPGPLHCDYKLA